MRRLKAISLRGKKRAYNVGYSHEYPEGRYGHKREINNVNDLKASLRSGSHAWPGGYPIYFITSDGEALSFETVIDELPLIMSAIRDNDRRSGWRVVGVDVNYEDNELYDAHTSEKIESAYGDS